MKFTKKKNHKRIYRKDEADIMAAQRMIDDISALKEMGIGSKTGKGLDYYEELSNRLQGK